MPSYERPILTEELNEDGTYAVPKSFGAAEEVKYQKRRLDSVRISQYADSKCGLPATYDPTGSYMCAGRRDGSSPPCNKLVFPRGIPEKMRPKVSSAECLIRIKPVTEDVPGCAFWEIANAGDPEGRYPPAGKMEDSRIGFGMGKSPQGFGCKRCWWGRFMLPHLDSEGRPRWCLIKGHPVENNSCCWDNEAR